MPTKILTPEETRFAHREERFYGIKLSPVPYLPPYETEKSDDNDLDDCTHDNQFEPLFLEEAMKAIEAYRAVMSYPEYSTRIGPYLVTAGMNKLAREITGRSYPYVECLTGFTLCIYYDFVMDLLDLRCFCLTMLEQAGHPAKAIERFYYKNIENILPYTRAIARKHCYDSKAISQYLKKVLA